MTAIDWNTVLAGTAVGVLMSALYFAGLAFGMRRALLSANPVTLLTLSAAFRMAVLLAAAWFVVWQAGPWSGLGFAAAFLVTRLFSTTLAKVTAP
jgi:predicted small integral membrane protein